MLSRFPEHSRAEIELAFAKGEDILEKSERANVSILSFYDKKFPDPLRRISEPPMVINTNGDLRSLDGLTGVAVIGTRQPTPQGVQAGEYFGKQLALQNFNVVSGLAIGCDAAAHRGALAAGGITTAILAHGLHTVYPKENAPLAAEILDKGGVLLSEYFIGTGALANYFVERDRLQAGLSTATVVVQTDEKGGTMHAVNATLASAKLLAAIQYKGAELDSPKTRGNQKLIREGKAYPLRSDNLVEFLLPLTGTQQTKPERASFFESPEELPKMLKPADSVYSPPELPVIPERPGNEEKPKPLAQDISYVSSSEDSLEKEAITEHQMKADVTEKKTVKKASKAKTGAKKTTPKKINQPGTRPNSSNQYAGCYF